MRRVPRFMLTTCLVSVSLLFFFSGPLFAQEKNGGSDRKIPRGGEEIGKRSAEPRQAAGWPAKQSGLPSELAIEGLPPDLRTADTTLTLAEAPPGTRIVEDDEAWQLLEQSPLVVQRPVLSPKKSGIELKKEELEETLRSHGNAGLATLLRFEKAKVCRKAGMYREAAEELKKIIEENLADETTIAARWSLAEILQEQKKNEEAISELEKIFISALEIQDRMDAMYGILTLSGEGAKERIQAIERLIQALLRDQANWDQCMNNLRQLCAAERKYAEDHGGYLSHKLSDLYPDYVDNLNVFTCPASSDPKITRKEDIDSLSSYLLVAKGEPAEGGEGEAVSPFPDGGRSRVKMWIREKEQNHGRRWFKVSSDGSVGWFAR